MIVFRQGRRNTLACRLDDGWNARGIVPFWLLLIATLLAFPATTMAQRAKVGSVKYSFQTLLIPNEAAERVRTVDKHDAWFTGKAVPGRAVILQAPVTITGTEIVLEKGTALSVATSSHFIGCAEGLSVTRGRRDIKQQSVCLIDSDSDGILDSWYKSSVRIIWNEYVGNLKLDDIYPITPTKTVPVAASELGSLPAWTAFSIRHVNGSLTYCTEIGCLYPAPKIKPSPIEQTAELNGGLFTYKQIDKNRLIVSMTRVPRPIIL